MTYSDQKAPKRDDLQTPQMSPRQALILSLSTLAGVIGGEVVHRLSNDWVAGMASGYKIAEKVYAILDRHVGP
jgi:hypothetical protein